MEEEFDAPDAQGLNFEDRKEYISSYIGFLESMECANESDDGMLNH